METIRKTLKTIVNLLWIFSYIIGKDSEVPNVWIKLTIPVITFFEAFFL